MNATYHTSFQSTLGPINFSIPQGSVTLVAGPNGVGKSALLHQLYRSLPLGLAMYLPGHRQININHGIDQLGQDIVQMRNNLYSSHAAFSRHKGHWAEDQFKGLLKLLGNSEASYNRKFRIEASSRGVSSEEARASVSPIDIVNMVFRAARLPISFSITESGLTANNGQSYYPIDALSDGERAALFIVASLVVSNQEKVILIDEPEKHLHPSITNLLITSALRFKGDKALVIATHDLSLIESIETQSTIYVRSSNIVSLEPETRTYDVEIIASNNIPDNLRVDILGSRSRVLFVEGTDRSRDMALFSRVFPDFKVSPKGSSAKVIESVRGASNSSELHWFFSQGIVDGDGRGTAEVSKLRSQGVHALPYPTIENLFFVEEMRKCFVAADLVHRGGVSYAERIDNLRTTLANALPLAREDIIARRACWRAQREISSHPLSPKDIKQGTATDLVVEINPIISSVTSEVDALLQAGDLVTSLLQLPIKNTDIPDDAARALGADSFKSYCDVVQRQLEVGSAEGSAALDALRALLSHVAHAPALAVSVPPTGGPRFVGPPPPHMITNSASHSLGLVAL